MVAATVLTTVKRWQWQWQRRRMRLGPSGDSFRWHSHHSGGQERLWRRPPPQAHLSPHSGALGRPPGDSRAGAGSPLRPGVCGCTCCQQPLPGSPAPGLRGRGKGVFSGPLMASICCIPWGLAQGGLEKRLWEG